ncbi:MAG TPA: hypothetical protein PLE30_01905 [Candidatus Kapabacteria bacterium]|nr:hypothetical protein [Candidatus Kapabacteria bacterium]
MKHFFTILLLILFIIACNKDNENKPEAIGTDTTAEISTEQKFAISQDSILKSYASAVRLINKIDDELTKLSNVPQTIETQNMERDILQKIEYLSFQLTSKNEEIKSLQAKLKDLSANNKKLDERLKTVEAILVEKDNIIKNQDKRISDLEFRLKIVISERDVALEGKGEAEKLATETRQQKNTAYYVIGTEDDLEKRNVISMEGEGFLGIGGKYVPSTEASIGLFKKIDITVDTILSFPANFEIDQIVSNHNKKYLEFIESPAGGTFMRIKKPEEFWMKDKTLIIIVKKK